MKDSCFYEEGLANNRAKNIKFHRMINSIENYLSKVLKISLIWKEKTKILNFLMDVFLLLQIYYHLCMVGLEICYSTEYSKYDMGLRLLYIFCLVIKMFIFMVKKCLVQKIKDKKKMRSTLVDGVLIVLFALSIIFRRELFLVIPIVMFGSIKAHLLIIKIEKKLHFCNELIFSFQIMNIFVRIIVLTFWITCFYFYFFQENELTKDNYNLITSKFNKNLAVLTLLGFKNDEILFESTYGEKIFGIFTNLVGFIFSILNGYNLIECIFILKENKKNK